jgi:hypothetical protein
MVTTKQACEMARELPQITEQDHFGSDAFRTPFGIFATIWHDKRTVNLRLTPEQQRRFTLIDGEGFREIDNAWGKQGWTTAALDYLDRALFLEALRAAYENRLTKPVRRRQTSGRGATKRKR